MSSKDIEKKLVGQPIFKQLIDFITKDKFNLLAKKHQTDRYYKAFPAWTQLVFDRAYNHYLQFEKFTQKQINFVCRLKSNVIYEIVQELFCQTQAGTGFGVLKEEHNYFFKSQFCISLKTSSQ